MIVAKKKYAAGRKTSARKNFGYIDDFRTCINPLEDWELLEEDVSNPDRNNFSSATIHYNALRNKALRTLRIKGRS